MAARPRRPTPQPLETDDVRLVAGGTAVWALALLVLLVVPPLEGQRERSGQWVWTCVFGIALGLIGIWHCRRRRAALQRGEPSPRD